MKHRGVNTLSHIVWDIVWVHENMIYKTQILLLWLKLPPDIAASLINLHNIVPRELSSENIYHEQIIVDDFTDYQM